MRAMGAGLSASASSRTGSDSGSHSGNRSAPGGRSLVSLAFDATRAVADLKLREWRARLIDTSARARGKYLYDDAGRLTPRGYSGGFSGERNPWDATAALEAFRGYVYSAADTIGKRVATVLCEPKLVLQDLRTKESETIEVHPLLDSLARPNELTDDFGLFYLTSVDLDLEGNSYWVKLRLRDRTIAGFLRLKPDLVKVVASTDGKRILGGINYYPNGTSGEPVGFERDEIVHFREPNPANQWYGLSRLEAAALEVNTHSAIRRYRNAVLENMARPDYVLSAKVAPNDKGKAQMREILAEVLIRHQGPFRAGMPLVLPADGIELKTLGFSFRDMELGELAKLAKADIFQIFGLNRYAAHDFDESVGSRAQAEAAEFEVAKATIAPRVQCIISALQRQVIEREGYLTPEGARTFRLFLFVESPIPEDREYKHKVLSESLRDKAISRDEYRKLHPALALDPYKPTPGEPGSYIYAPFGDVPIGLGMDDGAAAPARPELPAGGAEGGGGEDEDGEGKDAKSIPATGIRAALPAARALPAAPTVAPVIASALRLKAPDVSTVEKREALWKAAKPRLDAYERRIERVAAKAFRDQATRILPRLKEVVRREIERCAGWSRPRIAKHYERIASEAIRAAERGAVQKDVLAGVWDEAEERDLLYRAYLPAIRATYEGGAEWGAAQLGIDMGVLNEGAVRWLRQHTLQLSGELNEYTRRMLAGAIAAGIKEGESLQQIMERLKPTIVDPTRAARIARTETTTAMGRGTIDSWRQPELEGLVEQKMWVSSRDDRVRESHERIDGETVGLTGQFSNGLDYPGDPTGDLAEFVQCRCVIAPVLGGASEPEA